MSNKRKARRPFRAGPTTDHGHWMPMPGHTSDCGCVIREVVPVNELDRECPCGNVAVLPQLVPTQAPVGAFITVDWGCWCGSEKSIELRVIR